MSSVFSWFCWMLFITFGICFPHPSSMEFYILYFAFCLLNPHPIAPTSHPMNIPLGFIPTVLGVCALDGTSSSFMAFSFLLSLFLYKNNPWDPSTGDLLAMPRMSLLQALSSSSLIYFLQKCSVVILPFLLFPHFLSHFFPSQNLLLKTARLPNPSAFKDKLIWSYLGRA